MNESQGFIGSLKSNAMGPLVSGLLVALLFGFADARRVQLGIIGSDIPSQFLAMTPYLATIFAVAGLVGHSRPPAAEGTPYKK